MVVERHVHGISGGMTFYLEAMPKGAGHDRGLRKHPLCNVTAKQRAFGLKNRYLRMIFDSLKDSESVIKDISDLKNRHMEDIFAGIFS